MATHNASAGKMRNIRVLHAYHQGLQWTDSISAGIQYEFKTYAADTEIHNEYLDTKRNPEEAYFKRVVEFESLKTKLARINFEAIIASDNTALRFIVDHADALYPNVPVVFGGINDFHTDMLKGKTNITGVVENIDYNATLELMKKLHPERRKLLIVLDKTPTGRTIKNDFKSAVEAFSGRFQWEYYQDFILSEVPRKMASLGQNDIVYLLTINRDRRDDFISYIDGIEMIQRSSKVPIYGSSDFYFGNGIVGGMITSGFSQGAQAAKLVKQILSGTPIQFVPDAKKIRDDKGYWNQIESYIDDHSEVSFSHGICPDRMTHLYPEIYTEGD